MSNTENNARTFFGRQAERDQFQQRLAQPRDDQHRLSVWNIWGVDGVGKTELVGQLLNAARQQPNVTGIKVDDQVPDVPTLLKWLADDLTTQGWKFKEFLSGYKVWKASPEAQGWAQRVPEFIGGLAGAFIPATGKVVEASGKLLLSGWDKRNQFLRQTIERNPIAHLTEVFTQDFVEQSQTQKLVLVIDEFDAKRSWLEGWLLGWLHKIGDASPLGLTVILVSQKKLADHFNWVDFPGLVTRHIIPFNLEGTRAYCEQFGITDLPEFQNALHAATNGMPFFLPKNGKTFHSLDEIHELSKIISNDSFEKYLIGVDDYDMRWMMVQAALPRAFNLDVLTILFGEEKARHLFEPLTKMSFIPWSDQKNDGTHLWIFHPAVRLQFLRHFQKVSKREWRALHGQLANYYEEEQSKLDSKNSDEQPAYFQFTTELIYHRFCQDPAKNLAGIINIITENLLNGPYQAGFTKALHQAEIDCDIPVQQRWGYAIPGMAIQKKADIEQQFLFFQRLLDYPELRSEYNAPLHGRRGELRLMAANLAEWVELSDKKNQWVQEAQNDFEQAIALDTTNALYYARKGELHQLLEENELALKAFTKSIELEPENASFYQNRANGFAILGKWDEALTDIHRAIELEPDQVNFYLAQAEYHLAKQEREAAYKDLQHALALEPHNIQIFINLLKFYMEEEKWNDVITMATDLLASPDLPGMFEVLKPMVGSLKVQLSEVIGSIRKGRGVAYHMLARYDEAIPDFSYRIDNGLADSQDFFRRAECFYYTSQTERAFVDYQKAIELAPENVDFLAIRGQRYLEINRKSKALNDFSEAIERSPDNPVYYLWRGLAYQNSDRNDLAISDFTQAITLEPYFFDAHYSRGISYGNSHEFRLAIADLEVAIANAPEFANPKTFSALASCYLEVGDAGKATEYFLRSLDLNTEDILSEE